MKFVPRKPRILITSSNVVDAKIDNITGDTDIVYSDRATATAIIAAGGLPLYMPTCSKLGQAELEAYLQTADAILVTGADTNVNPAYYGEKPTQPQGRVDDERDRIDIRLVQLAYKQKLPILGICKGMQIINVALGGTLYQDVTVQHPSPISHNIAGKRTNFTHTATLAKGSLLEQIFGTKTLGLNGGHRQAVKVLAEPLQAIAVAEDGITEAYEGKNHPFLLGMQFHAELMTASSGHSKIFKQFIAAARQ